MIKAIISFGKNISSRISNLDGEQAATLSMRWARPIFFTLATTMFVLGWFYPNTVEAYFNAMSAAPDWMANILTILVLGLAVEKGISRPIKQVFEAIKGDKK